MKRWRSNTRQWVTGLFLLALVSTGWAQTADVGPLLGKAQTAVKAGDQAGALQALEQALERVRAGAPLTVNPFLLVTQPAKYYGDYAPRANNVFQRGEPLQFYLEPKNLVTMRASDGTYTPGFDVDLQILMAGGKVLGTQEKFGSFRLASKSPVQDIFMNLKVTLSGAPAGDYQVRLVVKDANSKKTATVTQPITIK